MKHPKVNDLCKVLYDGRVCKATVTEVFEKVKNFNVVTSFGHEMTSIPFEKFRPLYVIEVDPKDLLRWFWQRTSDACPLEATEMEHQENEWKEFIEENVTYRETIHNSPLANIIGAYAQPFTKNLK